MQSAEAAAAYADQQQSQTFAQDNYARLTRETWQNYIQNFVPIENELIEYATSPDTVTNAVSEARSDVASAFQAQQGSTQRRLFGMGVNLEPDEKQSLERSSAISNSLADVNAANMTARQTRQRQQTILGNPAPDLGLGTGL
jgi:hypothetical protein